MMVSSKKDSKKVKKTRIYVQIGAISKPHIKLIDFSTDLKWIPVSFAVIAVDYKTKRIRKSFSVINLSKLTEINFVRKLQKEFAKAILSVAKIDIEDPKNLENLEFYTWDGVITKSVLFKYFNISAKSYSDRFHVSLIDLTNSQPHIPSEFKYLLSLDFEDDIYLKTIQEDKLSLMNSLALSYLYLKTNEENINHRLEGLD
ncbi:hypothetical protein ACJA23_01290 [Mycoplasma corogypsi]|uniref:hypothetical protein n=1 Tax=Mycoplasma corogypsi TaxID=2106 RepID=UPI003872CB9D